MQAQNRLAGIEAWITTRKSFIEALYAEGNENWNMVAVNSRENVSFWQPDTHEVILES